MPKVQRVRRIEAFTTTGQQPITNNKDLVSTTATKKTLESYLKSSRCIICRNQVESSALPICNTCSRHPDRSLLTIQTRLNTAETKAINLEKICRSCASLPFGESVRCNSKDCPVFYTRVRHMAMVKSLRAGMRPVKEFLEKEGDVERERDGGGSRGVFDW